MREIAVILLIISLFVPTYTLLSQEEDSTETPDKQVSFSDITKQAFSSDETSGGVSAASVDSTTVASDEPWVNRKRVVTVNSDVMADEPVLLNMFSDINYGLIPNKFEEETVDFTVISSDGAVYDTKHISGILIDSTDNEVGTGSMTSVKKDGNTGYAGSFKLDGGKLYEVNTDEDLTTELTEFKDNQYYPLDCTIVTTTILTVTKSDINGGTIISTPQGIDCGDICSTEFNNIDSVTLDVTASAGYEFSDWTGDCLGVDTATTINMDTDKSCTANFIKISKRLRLMRKGSGTITISPTLGHPDGMECTNCTLMQTSVDPGSTVTITATPSTGYTFSHWSGSSCPGANSIDNPLTITVNSNVSCKANFVK